MTAADLPEAQTAVPEVLAARERAHPSQIRTFPWDLDPESRKRRQCLMRRCLWRNFPRQDSCGGRCLSCLQAGAC